MRISVPITSHDHHRAGVSRLLPPCLQQVLSPGRGKGGGMYHAWGDDGIGQLDSNGDSEVAIGVGWALAEKVSDGMDQV
jgi:hypothetical protein